MLVKKWWLQWSTMSITPIFCIGKRASKGYIDIVKINQMKAMHTHKVVSISPEVTFCNTEDLFDTEVAAQKVRDEYLSTLNMDLSKYEIK